MFIGRKLLIATKHHKEIVMAKHLQSSLGVLCEVTKNYDTDLLGTFSGEIERNSSPLETVKQKCIGAMEKYGYDLGVANEGSFGPHPTLFFVPANEEYIIFVDKKNDLEIVVKKLSTDTNFSGRNIKSEIELEKFIKAIHFPSHAVILRKSPHQNEEIIKDIKTKKDLLFHFKNFIDKYGQVYVETDMRAMNNPTRMKLIEATTIQLIEAIKSKCPQCESPGFVTIKYIPGLPCLLCAMPTKSIKMEVLGCKKCGYTREKNLVHPKKGEDPQFCDYCNP